MSNADKFFAEAANIEKPSIQPCPGCGSPKHKSERACPSCGFGGISPQPRDVKVLIQNTGVQTIEKTSKRWKKMMLRGLAAIALGACLGIVAVFREAPMASLAGVFIGFIGVCMYVYSRIMAWWHHG